MIRFETKLNEESTKQLSVHSFSRLVWVMLILSVVFIGLGLIGYFAGEDEYDRIYGITMIVFGVLVVPLVWVVTRLLQKYVNKSAKFITDETDEVYEFYEETVRVKQVSTEMQADATYTYNYLYKVEESATHYFLYISKMQCHIVPKNSLTEGNLDELNERLRLKLGQRFRAKR